MNTLSVVLVFSTFAWLAERREPSFSPLFFFFFCFVPDCLVTKQIDRQTSTETHKTGWWLDYLSLQGGAGTMWGEGK